MELEIRNAVSHYEELLLAQLLRQQEMEKGGEKKDFSKQEKIRIGLIDGDGIGPVSMESARGALSFLLEEELRSGKAELCNIEGLTIENRLALEQPVPDDTLAAIRECDVLINVPVLKVHSGAAVTCCMKNLMGIVSKEYQRKFHASGLNRCIAECASVRRPDLNIVDAYRVMTKRGPRGVDASDVRELGYLLAGCDMVALDTAGAKMLQVPPRKVGYLADGEELGLGTRNLDALNIRRITL